MKIVIYNIIVPTLVQETNKDNDLYYF